MTSPVAADGTECVGLAAADDDRGTEVTIEWVVADALRGGRIDIRVARAGAPLVVVIDDDLPPAAPGRFELRAPALWVDLVVETPLEHVTFGLEAFGLVLDDGAEPSPDSRGERVPVGLDLEWETSGPVTGRVVDGSLSGYRIPCRTHGVVVVGDRTLELAGPGHREHLWGP